MPATFGVVALSCRSESRLSCKQSLKQWKCNTACYSTKVAMCSMATQSDDIAMVRALVVRERYLKDTYQWDRWRACYHPDASNTRIETVWISGTIDDFLAGSREMSGSIFSRHLIQPVDAKVSCKKALIVSYGHVLLRASFGSDGTEYDVFAWGWWYHRACLVEPLGGIKDWKLTSMRFVYDRDSIMPTQPAGGKSLDKLEFGSDTRQSYKYLEWMLTQLNYPVSKSLAGTDEPETVLKVREEEEAWLAA